MVDVNSDFLPKNLIKIANASRKEIEDFAKQKPYIKAGFDLCGYCAIGSMMLYQAAIDQYEVEFVQGYHGTKAHFIEMTKLVKQAQIDPYTNHCWVLYEKDIIIDITATQFGKRDKVYITPAKDEFYHKVSNNLIFDDDDWENQNPHRYTAEIQKIVKKINTL